MPTGRAFAASLCPGFRLPCGPVPWLPSPCSCRPPPARPSHLWSLCLVLCFPLTFFLLPVILTAAAASCRGPSHSHVLTVHPPWRRLLLGPWRAHRSQASTSSLEASLSPTVLLWSPDVSALSLPLPAACCLRLPCLCGFPEAKLGHLLSEVSVLPPRSCLVSYSLPVTLLLSVAFVLAALMPAGFSAPLCSVLLHIANLSVWSTQSPSTSVELSSACSLKLSSETFYLGPQSRECLKPQTPRHVTVHCCGTVTSE